MGSVEIKTLLLSLTSQMKLIEKLKVFDENEIKAMKNHREFYGINLTKDNPTCEDLLQYVRYELDLLAVIREKKVDESLLKTKNTVTYSSGNLLNRLFNMLVENYPDRIQLWFLYVTFCREMKDTVSLLKVIENLLKVHKNKPAAFQLASRIAREDMKNLSQARDYLMNGIRIHIDSQELYKEAFLMELSVCKIKYESAENKEELVEESDFRRALELVYNAARTKIHSANFFVDLFHLVKGLSYAQPLENRILDDLRKRFPNEEITWETLADVKYEQLKIPENQPNYKKIVEELIKIYKTAVTEHLNTESMWSRYIDRMLLIHNDATMDLPNFRKNCVIIALTEAHLEKQLSEKYYLIWCELQKDEERKLKLLLIAAERLPTSATLWMKIISNRLAIDDETKVWRHFHDSLSHFKTDETASLPIWKFMLRYYQCVRPDKVDMLFREAIAENSGVGVLMKPMYLEWMTMSKGIIHGRELYNEIATTQPYSMALHDKMIELENTQVKLNVRSLRRCHVLASEQFGSHDTTVWMRWIQFEYSIGKSKNILNIKDQAMTLLQPALIDEFSAEMRLFEIECLTSWTQKSAIQELQKSLCRLPVAKKRTNANANKSNGIKKRRLYV